MDQKKIWSAGQGKETENEQKEICEQNYKPQLYLFQNSEFLKEENVKKRGGAVFKDDD